MIDPKLKGLWWWGYLHSNGTIQVKQWLGDHADYTTDCQGNPFVRCVVKPFQAESWDAAYKIIYMHLKNQ
jgi:hypothetical protein